MSTGRLTSSDHDGIGIVNFLQGNNFFITGATGFLGKVLVEKILRSTPNVGKIFLLVRGKDKEEAKIRVKNEIVDVALFKSLKKTHGNLFGDFITSKLIPVVGNVGEPNLGLDTITTREIAEEIDVIVNSAANTTWDERYDVLRNTNAKGPARVLEFAKKCKKLKLLLHVSTDQILCSYGQGQLPGFAADPNTVPGDMVVNAIIAIMAKHGTTPSPTIKPEEHKRYNLYVYQIASSVANPLPIGDMLKYAYDQFTSSPLLDSTGKKKIGISPFKFSDSVDSLSCYLRNHTNNLDATKQTERVIRWAQLYQPYTFIKARFDMENIKNLMREMSVVEMNDFGFVVESIDWENYFKRIHLPGLRRHALKEPPARARL
ncbi:hypothetical protein Tsubulata_021874 [Turnera subulata]|uniref:Fatty acyl-CoA reductase n=1 Tax=Turnera subulata TaxID=218843 RepID=A0A9Q0FRX8_9ROSI|nr:hypothetical protein Tsubulata_021874 [Turnera subulata]